MQNGALYLYSDGVTEAPVADDKMLGESGLIELIARYRGQPAAKRLADMVKAIMPDPHRQEWQLHDDITLLLLDPE